MFRSLTFLIALLLCLTALASGQAPQTSPTQQQTALPPEAINEPLHAIKASRAPLPSEVDDYRVSLEVIRGDWRRNYKPYPSNKADLSNKE